MSASELHPDQSSRRGVLHGTVHECESWMSRVVEDDSIEEGHRGLLVARLV